VQDAGGGRCRVFRTRARVGAQSLWRGRHRCASASCVVGRRRSASIIMEPILNGLYKLCQVVSEQHDAAS
jgi:hypothetical protein